MIGRPFYGNHVIESSIGGVLTYETNHFSDFAVFIEDALALNDDDDGGFPVCAIVLIVVAVIAVAGGVGGYILLQKKV